MEPLPARQSCTVCGGPNLGSSSICPLCEEAFHLAYAGPDTTEGIDLNRYSTKAFRWEPSGLTRGLLSHRGCWAIFCLGVVVIVVLLALFRTVLPTCGEALR